MMGNILLIVTLIVLGSVMISLVGFKCYKVKEDSNSDTEINVNRTYYGTPAAGGCIVIGATLIIIFLQWLF